MEPGKAEINLILLFSISLLYACDVSVLCMYVRVCICRSDSGIILRLLFWHTCGSGTCTYIAQAQRMNERTIKKMWKKGTGAHTHSVQLYGIKHSSIFFSLLCFYMIIKYLKQ